MSQSRYTHAPLPKAGPRDRLHCRNCSVVCEVNIEQADRMRTLNSTHKQQSQTDDRMTKENKLTQGTVGPQPSGFRHQRIDPTKRSIRLINVDPELSPDGFIQCDILHTTLEATYQCLSYRWGNDQPSYTVLIRHALEDARPFKVGKSLYDFLSRFRTEIKEDSYAMAGTTSLWIDALCIDQTNTSERNDQVGQMDQVFHNAERVLVWLGETMQPASEWIGSIETIRLELFKSATVPHYHHHPCVTRGLCYICRCRSFLEYVLADEYWNRAWVTQEIILAERVYLLLVGRLFEFSTIARHFTRNEPPGRFLRLRQTMPCVEHRSRRPLLSLLNELRGKLCSRPYDRIYSILGLVDEQSQINVDYNQSPAAFALDILGACGTELCLCAVLLVIQVLGVRGDHFSKEFEDAFIFLVIGSSSSVSKDLEGASSCPQLRMMLAQWKDQGLVPSTMVKQDRSDDPVQIVRISLSACASGTGYSRRVELCEGAKSVQAATPVSIGLGLRTEADVARHEATFRNEVLSARSSISKVARYEASFRDEVLSVRSSIDPLIGSFDIQSRFINALRTQSGTVHFLPNEIPGVINPRSSLGSCGFITPVYNAPGQWTLSLLLRRPFCAPKGGVWLETPSRFGEELESYVTSLLESELSWWYPADLQKYAENAGRFEAPAGSFAQLVAQFKRVLAHMERPGHGCAKGLAEIQWRFFIAMHRPLLHEGGCYFDFGVESAKVNTWVECLEDLARYRIALANENDAGQQRYSDAERCWHSRNEPSIAAVRDHTVNRHLAKLARPDAFRQLCESD